METSSLASNAGVIDRGTTEKGVSRWRQDEDFRLACLKQTWHSSKILVSVDFQEHCPHASTILGLAGMLARVRRAPGLDFETKP